ncbi:MAG TPA: hypothetical protein ENK49_08635 [Gammaproteobacteria bacterium]|nr:hypothetical protein [Gammaproteobacteria bacterium]
MKSCTPGAPRRLLVALGMFFLSPGVAVSTEPGSTLQADDGNSLLADALTLEVLLPVAMVVLALVVIARRRKAR